MSLAPIAVMICCVSLGSASHIKIDADFPGGNIIVDRIEERHVYLRQDLRDTAGWWFYWSFRVSQAAGRTVTFHFTNRNVIGTRGPAVSLDGGRTWSWLGTETVKAEDEGTSFTYSFAPDADTASFAFAFPYRRADLERFLARYAGNEHLAVDELCKTSKGRSVERIRIGRLAGEPRCRILLTCRHHSCESVASYVLEGAMAALLADTDTGKWFQKNVEVLVIPFVDKDGVEDGDQGKNRRPHDHNRDYEGVSLHPSVRALREYVPRWSDKRLAVALDLHCPSIRGKTDEVIYLVGSPDEDTWREQCRISGIIESVCGSSLPFKSSDNLPFGEGWNNPENFKNGKSFSRWAGELDGVRLSSTIEIPYANVRSVTVTPDAARAFGADLIRAIQQYLR